MSDEKEVYHLYAPQDETADSEASRAIADQYGNVIDESYSTKDESSHLDEKIDEHIDNKNNPHSVTKAQIGLGNVDNTSDLDKPISTQTQVALNAKATVDALQAHENNKNNPHEVTKAQIGLSDVDNTSDLNKPVSIPTQTALNDKVDKIAGKGLSTNDFSNVDKSKLSGIEADAQVNILEGVKVNGTDLTITDKKVDIDLSSFITKTVNDLVYYYTKAEVNDIVGSLKTISIQVVQQLPQTGESNIIYLVADQHATGDIYDEYIWVESTSSFEKIGNTDIDLSQYPTISDMNAAIATALSSYYTKTESDTKYAKLNSGNTFTAINRFNQLISLYSDISNGNDVARFTESASDLNYGALRILNDTQAYKRYIDLRFTNATDFRILFTNDANTYDFDNSKIYTTGTADLGSNTYKWRNLYLSGNLSDGTNSITVADIVKAKPNLISITYSELKTLRDNAQLIPGMYYRITDYMTIVQQYYGPYQFACSSAQHQFDIVVFALSTNQLSEDASALQHEGDTYFDGQNLHLWRLKYSLDNDANRFSWASQYGKGVIYKMIDNHNNEAPYDFKNILFTLAKVMIIKDSYNGFEYVQRTESGAISGAMYPYAWTNGNINYYTASETPSVGDSVSRYSDTLAAEGKVWDVSLKQTNKYTFNYVENNENKDASMDLATHDNVIKRVLKMHFGYDYSDGKQYLNFIVLNGRGAKYNRFDEGCYNIRLCDSVGGVLRNNTFGKHVRCCRMSSYMTDSSIDDECVFIVSAVPTGYGSMFDTKIGDQCDGIFFKMGVDNSVIKNKCGYLTSTLPLNNAIIDENCKYITFEVSTSTPEQRIHLHANIVGAPDNIKQIDLTQSTHTVVDVYPTNSIEMFI